MNVYKKNIKFINTCKALAICAFFVMTVCIAFQIYISNIVALKGMDYKDLFQKKAELEREIALLQYKDSTLSSLTLIEQKAVNQGFIRMIEPLNSITPPSLASLNIQ
ncbi:hypothetical protein A2V49_03125 [candidate division WWE3 bacterium RBG_19FT_COMBO_34_6]|uniref:Cell division protein FtsL n=1 Tax=candidate division WWE3 bacterium RBG_19FT_COMBO_34_6 TaxID=1802612 RepID=A0A1F4UK88_UNCKA|nr:MAG: hypothetical protein A2V49_03125 [candidate division WWE3 bacterium RBG_19FT_COMBO_34_6]